MTPVGSTKFRERGYDVVVACNLAKVDVPVRFRLPAPVLGYMQNVGAVAIIYEEQKNSSIEIIKSFRKHNPYSSIVIYCDGIVSDIDDICKEYKCECVVFSDKIGYPASTDLTIPLEYFYRFLYCSNLIKEKYYINLEPDCLVTGNLILDDIYDSFMISTHQTDWSFNFCGDVLRRNNLMYEIFDLYKLHLKSLYLESNVFDQIIGGGGMIYNKKFFIEKIFNNWSLFKQRCFSMKELFDKHKISDEYITFCPNTWYFDYMLSLQLPFYLDKKENILTNDQILINNIIHPFKKYYK